MYSLLEKDSEYQESKKFVLKKENEIRKKLEDSNQSNINKNSSLDKQLSETKLLIGKEKKELSEERKKEKKGRDLKLFEKNVDDMFVTLSNEIFQIDLGVSTGSPLKDKHDKKSVELLKKLEMKEKENFELRRMLEDSNKKKWNLSKKVKDLRKNVDDIRDKERNRVIVLKRELDAKMKVSRKEFNEIKDKFFHEKKKNERLMRDNNSLIKEREEFKLDISDNKRENTRLIAELEDSFKVETKLKKKIYSLEENSKQEIKSLNTQLQTNQKKFSKIENDLKLKLTQQKTKLLTLQNYLKKNNIKVPPLNEAKNVPKMEVKSEGKSVLKMGVKKGVNPFRKRGFDLRLTQERVMPNEKIPKPKFSVLAKPRKKIIKDINPKKPIEDKAKKPVEDKAKKPIEDKVKEVIEDKVKKESPQKLKPIENKTKSPPKKKENN